MKALNQAMQILAETKGIDWNPDIADRATGRAYAIN